MKFAEFSLRARWRKAALAVTALAASAALGLAGLRHASAHAAETAADPRDLRVALARDPGHAGLLRQAGRLALLEMDFDGAGRFYRAALQRRPYDADAWLELAFVFEARGDLQEGEAAALKSAALAPRSTRALLAAANFFARQDRWERAFGLFRRAAAADPRGAAPLALEACWQGAPDRGRILTQALPESAAAYEIYLQFLSAREAWDEAEGVVDWARAKGLVPGQEALLTFVDALIAARRPAQALRIWSSIRGPVSDAGNLIVNANFSGPMLNAGFDWLYAPAPGVELVFDQEAGGARSLAVRFTGQENPDYGHLRQRVPVRPGASYRLEALVKAAEITSTSGPRLEARDAYSSRLLASSEPLLGSRDWNRAAVEFAAPPETSLVTIGVRRPAAPAWDEKIAGILWLREFNLRPSGGTGF